MVLDSTPNPFGGPLPQWNYPGTTSQESANNQTTTLSVGSYFNKLNTKLKAPFSQQQQRSSLTVIPKTCQPTRIIQQTTQTSFYQYQQSLLPCRIAPFFYAAIVDGK